MVYRYLDSAVKDLVIERMRQLENFCQMSDEIIRRNREQNADYEQKSQRWLQEFRVMLTFLTEHGITYDSEKHSDQS